MCGIGVLFNPRGLPPALMKAFTDLVRHRGPDGEGAVHFHGAGMDALPIGGADTPPAAFEVGLPWRPLRAAPPAQATLAMGHRRLSILDLSVAGHQPMSEAGGRYWITFNGEIYNYVELREQLQSLGRRFVSHSDTEVILAAFEQWGSSCLDKLNGMFAFVIFDRARRQLFAARDRFGIKPLYYHVTSTGTLAFASEIKQFSVLPGWRSRLEPRHAYDFLAWGAHDHDDGTLFEGVFQLRGGESLSLTLEQAADLSASAGKRLPTMRWYQLQPNPQAAKTASLAAAAHDYRQRFEQSLRLHLRSDVPVGSCLSGGLDSSSIVCVSNRLLGEGNQPASDQHTFSAVSEHRQYDERPYIEEVGKVTGTKAHFVFPDPEQLFAGLDQLTWHQDEPFGSTSIFAQSCVFQLAHANGVKVMLDGQGADEQLAGYHTYFGAMLARLVAHGQLLAWWREGRALQQHHGRGLFWSMQQTANFMLPESLRQPLRNRAGRTHQAPSWLDLDKLGVRPHDPHLASGAAKARSIEDLSVGQLMASSVPALLRYEDRNSMAHSVESRVPFLEHELVEFTLGLPARMKIGDGTTKRVLREAMRGVLPEAVRTRMDKMGFVTAEEVWLRRNCSNQFRLATARAVEASRGIVTPAMTTVVEDMISGARPFSHAAWRCISFGNWIDVFDVSVEP